MTTAWLLKIASPIDFQGGHCGQNHLLLVLLCCKTMCHSFVVLAKMK